MCLFRGRGRTFGILLFRKESASFVEEVEAVAVDESTNGTFWKRNGLRFMLVAVILATGISLYAVLNRSKTSELSPASEFPCIAPSMAPTVDPLPTLDRIVNRGEVRCAVGDFYFETQLVSIVKVFLYPKRLF